MMKYLLLGASALALTATAAQAQNAPNPNAAAVSVPQINVSNQTAVGARFGDLNQSRPTDAADVNTADTGRSTFYNTGSRRESPISVIRDGNSVDGSLPADSRREAGDGNKATADQDGSNNLVNINQVGGNEGYAVVNQDNNFNEARITQTEVGDLSFQRSANQAVIQQAASGGNTIAAKNTATIKQHFDASSYTGAGTSNRANDAVIIQGDGGNNQHLSFANEASIEQSGADNEALVRQASLTTNGGGSAHIDQVGTLNYAVVRQGSSIAFQNAPIKGAVYQTGVEQTANLVQLGQGVSTGDIYQDGGKLNQADIVQNGGNATASIYQAGAERSQAFVEQTLLATNSFAAVEQNGGVENYADVYQTAASVDARVLQRGGSYNVAVVSQATAQSNAYVDTNGSNNLVTIRQ